jgi:hypothetical protein
MHLALAEHRRPHGQQICKALLHYLAFALAQPLGLKRAVLSVIESCWQELMMLKISVQPSRPVALLRASSERMVAESSFAPHIQAKQSPAWPTWQPTHCLASGTMRLRFCMTSSAPLSRRCRKYRHRSGRVHVIEPCP